MNRLSRLVSNTESLVIFGIIVALTMLLAFLVGRSLQRYLVKRSTFAGKDITSAVFLKHIVVATIYLFGLGWAFLTLPISKNYAHSLLAGAGASTLILGFAAQQVLGNLLSGVLIIVKRPFKINDVIEVQGNKGKVVELDLHATTIEDDNKDKIIIPNSLISNGIIKNYTSKVE